MSKFVILKEFLLTLEGFSTSIASFLLDGFGSVPFRKFKPLAKCNRLEHVVRLELTPSAWKAGMLATNTIRAFNGAAFTAIVQYLV